MKRIVSAAILFALLCVSAHAQVPARGGEQNRYTCEVAIGSVSSTAAVLANDEDIPRVCGNVRGRDLVIKGVACYANAGSPTVTPILTGGSGTSILTGALTCGTAAWAAGTVNGSPILHSFALDGATCGTTPCTLDANITTAGGVATYIVLRFVFGTTPN